MTLRYAYGFVLGISGMRSRMTLTYAIAFVDNQVMQELRTQIYKISVTLCSLFPVPCSLFPVPCSLLPAPCSLKTRNLYLTSHRIAIS
ncbi:hypothetical protein [Moorena sp. SIO4G3]|uniref:hypothetical protein n=1 Tax=Moorena sp. SIO4G3 TaxID=2607821 RepID=UPI00142C3007|nr:hypothetical protein [Moorena sp. SIO4G3]NEO77973.1 hypothetical protein [Moorena sp. SIO4G3]